MRLLCPEQNCLRRIQVAPCQEDSSSLTHARVTEPTRVGASISAEAGDGSKTEVTITYPDTDSQFRETYRGSVLRQRPHGYGVLKWRKGNYVRFDGEFKSGDMRQGTLYFGPNGRSTYTGHLRQCRAEGQGELAPDEADDNVLEFYRGSWHNGLKSGFGTARFRNGDMYEGDWRGNKMCGRGTYQWRDKTVYCGEFQEDEMHGPGFCRWANGLHVDLAFTHCYPNHVRSAVRVLCGVLLLLTLVYVMPHLVDMTNAGPSQEDIAEYNEAAAAAQSDSACDYEIREAPPLSSQILELSHWPWAWLWPWSQRQLEARAQARHEALILAMGGLNGVHIKGLWGLGGGSDASWNTPAGCVKGREGATGPATASDGHTAVEGFNASLSDVAESDDDEAEVYNADTFDVSTFYDDGSDVMLVHDGTVNSIAAQPVEGGLDGEEGGCVGADCPPATGVPEDATPVGSDEDDSNGSTILTVLTLYLRLHLKRQLHYLRLGMLALFTLTGDLEDAMSALVWPLLCVLCRNSLYGKLCNQRMSSPVFWTALVLATTAVAAVCVFVTVVIPEAMAEVVRLSCMEGLIAVPVHLGQLRHSCWVFAVTNLLNCVGGAVVMISDILGRVNALGIVLASGSPRRRELLTQIGVAARVVPSTFEEDLDKSLFPTPDLYVVENARQKALEVWQRLSAPSGGDDSSAAGGAGSGAGAGGDSSSSTQGVPGVIIGSDTVVVYKSQILEKPKSEEQAKTMLRMLSGHSHHVYTGVALVTPPPAAESEPKVTSFFESTEVVFAELSDPIINAYVATGEPMDKAGSYGIQGIAGSFVSGIRGDYSNVVGFPLHRFCRELRALLDEDASVSDDVPKEDA